MGADQATSICSYLQFMQEAHEHYRLAQSHVLHSVSSKPTCRDVPYEAAGCQWIRVLIESTRDPQNFDSLFSMLRFRLLRCLMSLHVFESLYSRACRFFETERLRRVFTFASMQVAPLPMLCGDLREPQLKKFCFHF